MTLPDAGPAGIRFGAHSRIAMSVLALAAVVTATLAAVLLVASPPAAAVVQPSAANTGVPAGTHLTVYNGDLTITRAGSTYSGLDIRGFVFVRAVNVTIKNSIIRGRVATSDTGLVNDVTNSGANFRIFDSELVPQHPSVKIDGIKGWNYTATRLNIHGTVDGAKVLGDNATIQNSYIHDLQLYSFDPDQNGPSHNDGVQVLGGRHIRILYNTIDIASNLKTAIQVSQDHSVTSDLWFNNNWADGAICTVNITPKPLASMSGIVIDDNQFGAHTPAACTVNIKPNVVYSAVGNVMTTTRQPARVRAVGAIRVAPPASVGPPTWFPQGGTSFIYGAAGDVGLLGDWNGDGYVGPGVQRGNYFLLKARATAGTANYGFGFGRAGDIPLAGDWDGNGTTTIGVWRAGVFYLRNTNSAGPADVTVRFGRPTDQPVVGDWNGDGRTDIGVRRGNVFYLSTLGSRGFGFGRATDQAVVGDWNGDGRATVGVRRGNVFYLSGNNVSASAVLAYGRSTDVPLAGDINRDHKTEIVLLRR